MKRILTLWVMSIALMAGGCEQQEADVDTAPPEGEPAVSGYRGEIQDEGDPPAATDLTDSEPADVPPTATEPQDVEDDPVVEEVPAENLPPDAETGTE